jgi:hypothetical protein
LEYLSFSECSIGGALPSEINDLTELWYLDLGGNDLSGDIPPLTLPKLQHMNLWDNEYEGPIPSWIFDLTTLTNLSLQRNNFSGPIPEGFGRLPNVVDVSLFGNRLSGEVPADFYNHPNFDLWNFVQNIQPQQPGYELSFNMDGFYESTDYSEDGKVIQLLTATRGDGVNVVLMGDGFTDKDMASGGVYETHMRQNMEYLFSVEPMKSYKEYFNVYMIKTVSKNDVFYPGAETALSSKFGAMTWVECDMAKVDAYLGIVSLDRTTTFVNILVNATQYAGTAFIEDIGACTLHTLPDIEAMMHHELIGHGIGKLADEYVYYGGSFPEEYIPGHLAVQAEGEEMNISFDPDPEKVPWAHFIGHPNYPYVGVYEGAMYYALGVWRPEPYSCMDDNRAYFNAPSREAIVKKILQIAGEEYSFEAFVAKDKYEPVSGTRAAGTPQRTPPPVRVSR